MAAETQATLQAAADRDDYGLGTTRFGADLTGGDWTLGWHARGRWYRYSLDQDLVGIRPFAGSEPAAELGGHWLVGPWWLAANAGFQGTLDPDGAVGSVAVARAFGVGAGTLTPRFEGGRRPFALSALPLSLGLNAFTAEAGLSWRSPGAIGEWVVRADAWDALSAAGRVENPALASIPANRRAFVSAYLLSQGFWLQGGGMVKAEYAQRNTLLPTQTAPTYQYTWYPVSIPLRAWQAALIGRVAGHPLATLALALQVQVPVISRETRRWESVEQSAWGTAPWDARAEATWNVTRTTGVFVVAALFVKPWTNWDVSGAGAYRQAAVQIGITQSL